MSTLTPGKRGPKSDGNEVVVRLPQASCIPEASPSNCLGSYPGHSLGESHPSAKRADCGFCSPSHQSQPCRGKYHGIIHY